MLEDTGVHYRIDCAKDSDRDDLVVILARNGYCVRIGRERRGKSNSGVWAYYVEYWR